MTVGDLLEQLAPIDKHLRVILSKDEEGNSFSPLDGIELALYTPTSTWSGEVDHAATPNAVVLWPTN